MAFPTYSMLSVILGSTILVLAWVASNKMTKCAAVGVHTNLQILMMVGTANVVLGFTGLLDHTAVKSAKIVNMVYIFAIGVITMVSSIFLLSSANAKANNPDGDTIDKKEGCESVDTEAMILAVIGGIIVLGFVSKVLEYWKAEQEVSSSELKMKQSAARAAKKQADLAQKAVDQRLEQQAHELEMQQRRNVANMKREKDRLEKLEAQQNAVSKSRLVEAEKQRREAEIKSQIAQATSQLVATQNEAKKVAQETLDLERQAKLAEQQHEKEYQQAIAQAELSRTRTENTLAGIEKSRKRMESEASTIRHGRIVGELGFQMKKGKKGKKARKRSSRKPKKGKKRSR